MMFRYGSFLWKLEKVYDIFRYDIPRFITNIIVQRDALWNARSYDHSGVYLYIRNQLHHMEKMQRKYANDLNAVSKCDRIHKVVLVLDRLIADEYDIERWNFVKDDDALMNTRLEQKYSFPSGNTVWKLGCRQRMIDRDYVFSELNKRLDGWWD